MATNNEGDKEPDYTASREISRHDARKASKLVRMLIDHTLSSSPSQQLVDYIVMKHEKERRIYGDEEDYGTW